MYCESGISPVHKAFQYGHDNIVQLLLNNSADINVCNKSGISQVSNCHVYLIPLLMQHVAK